MHHWLSQLTLVDLGLQVCFGISHLGKIVESFFELLTISAVPRIPATGVLTRFTCDTTPTSLFCAIADNVLTMADG